MLISEKMSSKWNIPQKNMLPVLLVSLSDVLSVKNVCHACAVGKFWGVVQVP